jgi:hypothetical protein
MDSFHMGIPMGPIPCNFSNMGMNYNIGDYYSDLKPLIAPPPHLNLNHSGYFPRFSADLNAIQNQAPLQQIPQIQHLSQQLMAQHPPQHQ